MGEKTVIVIGAGLAGLAAGCFLQKNGYACHIFEHHAVPGGVAAAWRRKGYLVDGGIHFMMGHKPEQSLYSFYQELGIVPAVHFVDLTTYGRLLDESSNWSNTVTQDVQGWLCALQETFPQDTPLIDELASGIRAFRGLDMGNIGLEKPRELMGVWDALKLLWKLRRHLQYFKGRYAQSLADFTSTAHDPRLKACIESLFLPQVPVFFILMVLALLADGNLSYLQEGSLNLALTIERHYKVLGGKVTYNATVDKILVENNRAVGIKLTDGSEHRADVVVSAADGYSTIYEMLGGVYVNEKIQQRYEHWPLFQPMVMANFGVARQFHGEPPFSTILLEHPLRINEEDVPKIFVRIFNYSPCFAPEDKTVVQVEVDTEWDYWHHLHEDRVRYAAEKERIAAEILTRLERHYPGISQQVEMTDVATPYTTWRYTRNYRGAWEGWMMSPDMMTMHIERTLPGLANFYMAGQWVMPGGGVVPSLYSGRHVAQLLCQADKKRFV